MCFTHVYLLTHPHMHTRTTHACTREQVDPNKMNLVAEVSIKEPKIYNKVSMSLCKLPVSPI